ncbi:hypothetical protein GCM10027203_82560 [Nonomuraea fastidiosa]
MSSGTPDSGPLFTYGICPATACENLYGNASAPAREARTGAQGKAEAQLSSSAVMPRVMLGSTGTPGPIVVEKVTFFR